MESIQAWCHAIHQIHSKNGFLAKMIKCSLKLRSWKRRYFFLIKLWLGIHCSFENYAKAANCNLFQVHFSYLYLTMSLWHHYRNPLSPFQSTVINNTKDYFEMSRCRERDVYSMMKIIFQGKCCLCVLYTRGYA